MYVYLDLNDDNIVDFIRSLEAAIQPAGYVEFEDGITDDEMIAAAEAYESERQARIENAQFLHDLWQATQMSLEGLSVSRRSHRSDL